MSKPLVPEIRFGGYSEPWKSDILDNIVNRKGISSSDACLPRVEYEDIDNVNNLINKDINQKQSSKKGLLFEPNDILFGKLRPYLRNHILPDFKGIAVGDFWIFDPKDNDSQFIFRLAFSKDFEYVANMSAGSKMPRADWDLVSSTSFQIPTETAEQKEIGEWFKRLDDMIANAEKEVTRLEKMKIASLQKMFPRPGQTTPEVRFGGYQADWETTTIENILSIGNGCDYKHLGDGSIPVFGTGGYMTSVDDYLMDGESVFIGRKGTIDKPFYYKGKFWTVDTLFYTHSFKDVLPYYVYCLFQTIQWYRYNEATGVPSLSKQNIGKISVRISKSLAEQDSIGRYFFDLDNLITKKRDRIVKLRNIKKACLEKMFVNNTTEQ